MLVPEKYVNGLRQCITVLGEIESIVSLDIDLPTLLDLLSKFSDFLKKHHRAPD